MPVTIPAFLQNPRITGIVRTADVPTTYMLQQRWFPDDDVDADEFESLIVLDQVDLAPFVALDAETPRMADDIVGSYKWNVAYMRYKKSFKESDLRVFFEPGVNDQNSLTAANARAAERKILRYADVLSMSIDARKEWLAANAIAGAISYNDTHVQYSVTYDGAYIGSSKRKTPSTLWSASSPTIVTNLSNWVEEISDETGHESWAMITSQKVLGLMARSSDVRELWMAMTKNPASATPDSLNPMSTQMVAGALSMLGINEVIRYSARYTTRTEAAGTVTRTRARMLNENDVHLLPIGVPLGRTASAPAKPNGYRSGKFGWSKEIEDPWVVEVGAGEYAWIDFPPTKHNWTLQARVC